jgi:hypothetical protein
MEAKSKERQIAQKRGMEKELPSVSEHISAGMSAWTDNEDNKLREVFPFSSDDDLESLFQRSITSIKGRAYRLGLKKHWSLVQSVHKRNARSRWDSIKKDSKALLPKNVNIRAGKKAIPKNIDA